MDVDTPEELLADFKDRRLGLGGVAQIAAGTGLAVYAMWAGLLQPGFRRVPLRLQVPYLPASKTQVRNVMTLLRGRKGTLVDLGSGDGRIVSQSHIRTMYLKTSNGVIRNCRRLSFCHHVVLYYLWKVLEAHRQGFSPTIGYELNPWLVRLSWFHAWRAGHHHDVSYRREDLWK
ncbi:hypothetical protein CRUP_001988, partial [Coryphaenoides rupestris]